MGATRQDAWSPDDDLLLAEVTLRYIREGGTQLAAFEEVAQKLGRTSAACGFRWNSTVRKEYEAAIALAKAERQKRKAAKSQMREREKETTSLTKHSYDELSFESIIHYLRNQRNIIQELQQKIKTLELRLEEKEEENLRLNEENEHMFREYNSAKTVSEDYRALLQIMERARKLTSFPEDGEKPIFKMDSNGNLERVNK